MTGDHVSDGKVDIPQAIIDAAVDAWDLHQTLIDADDTGWLWRCECGEVASAADADSSAKDAERHSVSAALAAAFAECEVTEEWGVDDAGMFGEVWPFKSEDHARIRAQRLGEVLYRRTITTITGPWVVVTPAQEETANG